MTTLPKHQFILDTLRDRIAAGDFAPGERIPSDSQLVREFGVSRPTIAKAVTELERRGLVVRRRGSGTFVKAGETPELLFGLLVPGLGDTEIFEPICAEIGHAVQSAGHSLLWGGTSFARRGAGGDGARLALELCDQYVRRRVAGVVFAPIELEESQDEVNQQIVARLTDAGVPIVLLDRDIVPHPGRSRLDLVGIDNRGAGRLVAEHLIERGGTRLAFLAKPGSAATVDARIEGFSEAARAGLRGGEASVHVIDPADAEAVDALMRVRRPDAIACGNDVTAARLLHTLESLGVRVPGDLLVAGFDDVHFAELLKCPLTTVHQPCEHIGRTAHALLTERIACPDLPPRQVLLSCDLVHRGSTDRTGC